ncbi:sulfotransferase family 2 domain-containing protein [Paracoccus sp. MBLB3053]|uniref:Sulfotransferase family 2 domain-containing protein n=1 Tax=Paracoccus aurantius TaxID=3073814 RepID=A0ABU2HU59_9RHOB|nr:sulfotransferase family 2 domain-containing protein [Paracoccus sp. MBLB3053]MDS9468582.1 sulfotransferase family 2 domain-containing protein [Paracoccus sp. MBLB3053]
MPFKDLDRVDLPAFIESERNEEALWLFMHIPKTAGSSFSEAMAASLSPYRNIEVDYRDGSRSFSEKISSAANRFIDEAQSTRFRSASGHLTYDLVRRIRASVENVKLITFLRDPVTRVISDYRYQRTPMHPPYREFIEKFPTLLDYINFAPSQNTLLEYICGREGSPSASNAIDILDTDFCFVGLQEMYPFSYYTMMELFGASNARPVEHRRKTPDTPETEVEVTDDVIKLIRDNNAGDLEVFEHVRSRLMRHRNTFARISG